MGFYGVGDTYIIETVGSPTSFVNYYGKTYILKNVYDPSYAGMDLNYCVTIIDNRNITRLVCTLLIGKYIGYPIFNHYGSHSSPDQDPQKCDCSEM